MFLSDVTKKDRIREIAVENLEDLGVKHKLKKIKLPECKNKHENQVFKVPLHCLPMITVTLKSGQQLIVPKILHEMCTFLQREKRLHTEGIFRREGTKSKQKALQNELDHGNSISPEESEINLAAIMKIFLRELPESVIPSALHNLFFRCSLLDKTPKLEALLLACLLLPMEHLCTLSYIMQFFHEVASYSDKNKMNYYNLSVVIGPNILRSSTKGHVNVHRLEKSSQIFAILVEHAASIGVLSKNVIDAINSETVEVKEKKTEEKKKKRRSGSLTRVISGFRKIVSSNKSSEIMPTLNTPDLLMTPTINHTSKKRKSDVNGLHTKKRKEIINKLPEATLLSTPFASHRTPISVNPNPKCVKNLQQSNHKTVTTKINSPKEKKLWMSRNKNPKPVKIEDPLSRRSSFAPRSLLERRWSAVNQINNLRKHKKRHSIAPSLIQTMNPISPQLTDETTPEFTKVEPNYVRIPVTEYEEIKNKVSAIERRISMELDLVKMQIIESNQINDIEAKGKNNVHNVQTVYEQTLEQIEPMSPTTDHLARRLSRELKIRNSEVKIIRSPSARKIGSLRRRSKEHDRHLAKLSRHQSWHSTTPTQSIPRINLKRGKPSTQLTGLKNNNQFICSTPEDVFNRENNINLANVNSPACVRSQQLQYSDKSFANSRLSFSSNNSSTVKSNNGTINCSKNRWRSAEGFFVNVETPNDSLDIENSRPSLAKLRTQNAGMVLAKAKLFDNLRDSDYSITSIKSEGRDTVKPVATPTPSINRTESARSSQNKLLYRAKVTKERTLNKKIASPRKCNYTNNNNKQKIQNVKQGASNNTNLNMKLQVKQPDKVKRPNISDCITPKRVPPHIKKQLHNKSPKRLCKTPNSLDRRTPLRALVNQRQQ